MEFEGPEGCGSYNGSLVGLGNGEMVLTSDPNMYLFSERMFDSPTCDLDDKFGKCSLTIADKSRDAYFCSTPSCNKKIHLKCDKSVRGKLKTPIKRMCPTCSNLDPVTWKRIKTIRLVNRN